MLVLIVGGGGREHALAWKISRSKFLTRLFVAPGNGGTAFLQNCENVPIAIGDVAGLARFAREKSINLVIVGPELPLVRGLADLLLLSKIPVFGPRKKFARLEGSKIYAKHRMIEWGIPTAPFWVFQKPWRADSFLRRYKGPIVRKMDGLAAGKGVKKYLYPSEARKEVAALLREGRRGKGPRRILIEKSIGEEAQELSAHVITDGQRAELLPFVRDYKHLNRFGEGPMTGGMGCYGPVDDLPEGLAEKVYGHAVDTLIEAAKLGVPYIGCLYPGIMVESRSPLRFSFLEYNVRWGDPECQVFMRLFGEDLLTVLYAHAKGESSNLSGPLLQFKNCWRKGYCVVVAMVAPNYPGDSVVVGQEITGIEKAESIPGVVVFHSGTRWENGKLLTAGGRVLTISAIDTTLADAHYRAYEAAKRIRFDAARPHYRSDIGAVPGHASSF